MDMATILQKLQVSPEKSAGFFSRLIFWWMTPLFFKGRKKVIQISEIYRPLDRNRSELLGDQLEFAWNHEIQSKVSQNNRPNLSEALIKVFGTKYLTLGLLAGVGELALQVALPLILGRLIRCFELISKSLPWTGELAPVLIMELLIVSILYMIVHHTYYSQAQSLGMQVRVAASALIFRKALKINNLKCRRTVTPGQVVNLLSNDVNRFDQVLMYLHFIWIAPVQLAIVIYILWGYFGVYCLTGVTVLVLLVPIQAIMGKLFGKQRAITAQKTDTRIRILNEVIAAIGIIKMQAWESLFTGKVIKWRKEEIHEIRRTAWLRAVNLTLHQVSSKLIIFITLLVYVLSGNDLTSEKVFVTIAFYNSVRRVFTYCVPIAICHWAESKISVQRIEKFLLEAKTDCAGRKLCSNDNSKEVEEPRNGQTIQLGGDGVGIQIKNLGPLWGPSLLAPAQVSFDLVKGSRVAIVGKTGSGKSTLLKSILQERVLPNGEIIANGSFAYAPQQNWLFEATIRENILFGQEFVLSWYSKVLEACALKEELHSQDLTVIGDKGTCLSGGQKARINLARAVYSKSDIILLDDPFSAVDAKVANHIFDECICKLLKDKICIFVTHQIQFLPKTDKILVLENGSIKHHGTFTDLSDIGVNFSIEEEQSKTSVNAKLKVSRMFSVPLPIKKKVLRVLSSTSEVNLEGWVEEAIEVEEECREFSEDCLHPSPDDNKNIPEKDLFTLVKSRNLYKKYILAGSSILGLILFALIATIAQTLYTGTDYWLGIWVKYEQSEIVKNNCTTLVTNCTDISIPPAMSESQRDFNIIVYFTLFSFLVLFATLRTFYFFHICMSSSINLHKSLFTTILHAPMSFFQENTIGSILNVFAKDIGIVDDLLPGTVFETLEAVMHIFGVVIVVTIVNPILLIPSVILIIVLFFVRVLYIGTAKNIKRIETLTKSPVFSHATSSFNGLAVIRAFKMQDSLRGQFDDHQDLHTAAWVLVLAATRWQAFVVEFISVIYIGSVAFSFMIFSQGGASVGLAISSAMTLSSMFQWGMRQSAEAESQLVSVERISKLSVTPPEPDCLEDDSEGPDNWPSNGVIKFDDFTVSCQKVSDCGDIEHKLILNNLNFQIDATANVGVVGRTGAGKSTLVSAIFRLVIPSHGSIFIDEKDISTLRLCKLRGKISIISQEPIIFECTLRDNIDPLRKYSDAEIWDTMAKVNMDEVVKELPAGLDTMVGNESSVGSTFSLGQKQLLSMGRALLQKNKILILDEATASLDKKTDELIQNTVRNNFINCTIISIAHRLSTVTDCDKILVLNHGVLMEYDSPSSLLSNRNGYFSKMMEEMKKSHN